MQLKAEPQTAGKVVRCPGCNTKLQIPMEAAGSGLAAPSSRVLPGRNPHRPRAYGGKGAEAMRKEIPSSKTHPESRSPSRNLICVKCGSPVAMVTVNRKNDPRQLPQDLEVTYLCLSCDAPSCFVKGCANEAIKVFPQTFDLHDGKSNCTFPDDACLCINHFRKFCLIHGVVKNWNVTIWITALFLCVLALGFWKIPLLFADHIVFVSAACLVAGLLICALAPLHKSVAMREQFGKKLERKQERQTTVKNYLAPVNVRFLKSETNVISTYLTIIFAVPALVVTAGRAIVLKPYFEFERELQKVDLAELMSGFNSPQAEGAGSSIPRWKGEEQFEDHRFNVTVDPYPSSLGKILFITEEHNLDTNLSKLAVQEWKEASPSNIRDVDTVASVKSDVAVRGKYVRLGEQISSEGIEARGEVVTITFFDFKTRDRSGMVTIIAPPNPDQTKGSTTELVDRSKVISILKIVSSPHATMGSMGAR